MGDEGKYITSHNLINQLVSINNVTISTKINSTVIISPTEDSSSTIGVLFLCLSVIICMFLMNN